MSATPDERLRPDWPALMTGRVAADYLGLSRESFERQVRHGRIKFVLPGDMKWRMYRRTDLDTFIAMLPARTCSAPIAPTDSARES